MTKTIDDIEPCDIVAYRKWTPDTGLKDKLMYLDRAGCKGLNNIKNILFQVKAYEPRCTDCKASIRFGIDHLCSNKDIKYEGP